MVRLSSMMAMAASALAAIPNDVSSFVPSTRTTTNGNCRSDRLPGVVSSIIVRPLWFPPTKESEQSDNVAYRSSTSLQLTKAVASAVAAATTPIVLPSARLVALTCLVPTLLGYVRSEYGVSYGYGTATAATAFLVLHAITNTAANVPLTALAACHAAALVFYGVRLDLFILYREVYLPKFRAMREIIEERANKRGSRISRTFFLVSCAVLYFGLTAPTFVTAKLLSQAGAVAYGPSWAMNVLRGLIYTTWGGFLLGALGDFTKSYSKAKKDDGNHLVTGGIYRYLRHPNYTGETIGWTANCLAAFFAVIATGSTAAKWRDMAPFLGASLFGLVGILFVLVAATTNLENRQKVQYGESTEYKEWVKRSWAGFTIGSKGNAKNT